MSVVANVAINVDSSGAVSKLRQVQQGAQATSQAVDKLNATTAATSDKFKIAANGIKYFTDATGRARAENGRFLTTAERAAAGIKLQGDAAQQASGKLNGLRNALAGIGAGFALRKSFIDASELESAQSRIGLLSKNFQQLTGIQDVASNAARKFNLSQTESLSALTDLGNRIGPTGASLEDVANVYEGFNTLLALNKVNSQNAASATLQLNQALGSGRLAGEEFNAISEATPQLLDAVAKVLGRNRGELKQLASDGQISSQVLIEALKRIRTEGAADLEASFGGAFGATRRFDAALEDFSATVGTELLPALTPLINKATEILKLFGDLPGPVKTTAVAILGLTAAFVVLAPAVAAVSLAAAPWLALAAGIAAAGFAILDAANAQRDFNNVIATAPLPDVNAKIQELESKLRAAETKLADVTAQFGPLSREAAFAQASVDGLKGSLDLAKGDYKIRLLFESVGVKPDARFLGPGFAAPAAPRRATPLPSGGNGGGRAAGADKAANEAKRKEEEAKREAKRAAEQIKDQQVAAVKLAATELGRLTIAETADGVQRRITQSIVQQGDIQREFNRKLNESKSAQETLNLQIAQQNALKTNALELELALAQEIENLTQPLQAILEESKQRLELENRYQKLLADGVNPELAKEFAQLELTAEKQTQLLTLRLGELEAAKAKLAAESDVAKALQSQIDKIKEILNLQGATVDASKQETEEERKKRTEREEREKKEKESAERLKNLYEGIASTIEDGIVASIQTGIDGLINGTKDLDDALKEILSGVLQEIANMLIKFAVRSAFSAFGFADGGVFASNGVQPFARGGVVGSPTLFPFADGGTTKTGLMGEAGPEAIMPLKRGGDGKLGVAASLDGAMSRYRRPPGAGGGGGEGASSESGAPAAGGPMAIDVRYSVERINDVEYVTASQFQAGMLQAAQQGAAQGEQRTLRRLQQSPSTRKRVGV